MDYILVGLFALLAGCCLFLWLAWLREKKKKEEDKEFLLYQDMVKQFYDMLGESPDTVPVPYATYKEMRELISKMRKRIVNNS